MRSITSHRPILTAAALLGMGFSLQSCGSEGPEGVAHRFWQAAQDRDHATFEALSIPSEDVNFNLDNEDSEIRSLVIGEGTIDGKTAQVETMLDMKAGETDLEVDFVTILEKRDGEWLVDIEGTTDEVMRAVMGASMKELGAALGEGLKGAMEGVAEGFAEGMQEMGEAFQEAAEEMKKNNEGSR